MSALEELGKAMPFVRQHPAHAAVLTVVVAGIAYGAAHWFYEARVEHLNVQVAELQSEIEKLRADRDQNAKEAKKSKNALATVSDNLRAYQLRAGVEGHETKSDGAMRAAQEDFSAWVNEFLKRQSAEQQQLDKSKSDAHIATLQRTAEVRALLVSMIDYLAHGVDAYSAKTGRKIKYVLPPLPDDPFSGSGLRWQGQVDFTKSVSWVLYPEVSDFDGAWLFRIVVDDGKRHEPRTSDSFLVRAYSYTDTWHTTGYGPNYSAVKTLEADREVTSNHQALQAIAKTLLETQLLLSFPH